MSLISHWTKKGKTEAEKKAIKGLFENSGSFRELLGDLLDDMARQAEEGLDFDSPGWPYKRASVDGKLSQIKTLKNLLMLDNVQ